MCAVKSRNTSANSSRKAKQVFPLFNTRMGIVRPYEPVKLIAGFIFSDQRSLSSAQAVLRKMFGPFDMESPSIPFTHTDYYTQEFGRDLSRKFVSFKRLIDPKDLAMIKIRTNAIEHKLSARGRRLINIDPGYITLAKLVLATTKDHAHRIYLQKGIYSEVTLFFKDLSFQAWPWTYPDYRTEEYLAFFNGVRRSYAEQITK